MHLAEHLFGFERRATPGERLYLRLFELFVTGAIVYVAWHWGSYIRRISDVVLPLGLAHYIDVSFLFDEVFPLVNAGLITLALLLGFFRVTRWGYLVAFVLLLLQYAARYSLGEIPHSANVVGMGLLALALAPLVFRDEVHRGRFAYGFTVFYVGLGYTLAAASKLVATGPTWVGGQHLWIWLHEKGIDTFSKTGEYGFNALQQLALDHWWIATLFLTIGLLSELGAFLIWWRPLRPFAGLAIAGLHIGIFLTMGILFRSALVLVLLVSLPWARWFDAAFAALKARSSAWPERVRGEASAGIR